MAGYSDYGPWEETPRWHPWRWFGWSLRRRIKDGPYHPDYDYSFWGYGRPRRVVHQALKEKFDVT